MKETISIKMNSRIKDVKDLLQNTPKGVLNNEHGIDGICIGDFFQDAFWEKLKLMILKNPKIIEHWNEYADPEIVEFVKQKINNI